MAKVIYDKSGSQVMAMSEYDIDANTNVAIDSYVKLTNGKVVNVAVGETGPILGIAAENHPGTADTFNIRGNGKRIKVYDAPSEVAEITAPQLTATGGTNATLIVNSASLAAGLADGDFVGGYMKLISKAVGSTNTDPVGTVYPITGYTAATKTFTTTQVAGGAITTGDVFAIFPPIGFQKGNFDANFLKYDLSATAALPVRTAGGERGRNVVHLEAALHVHGNKNS